jgi:hypothetical protein
MLTFFPERFVGDLKLEEVDGSEFVNDLNES